MAGLFSHYFVRLCLNELGLNLKVDVLEKTMAYDDKEEDGQDRNGNDQADTKGDDIDGNETFQRGIYELASSRPDTWSANRRKRHQLRVFDRLVQDKEARQWLAEGRR